MITLLLGSTVSALTVLTVKYALEAVTTARELGIPTAVRNTVKAASELDIPTAVRNTVKAASEIATTATETVLKVKTLHTQQQLSKVLASMSAEEILELINLRDESSSDEELQNALVTPCEESL